MARPLKKQEQSSSVASLLTKFDPEIGRAATKPVGKTTSSQRRQNRRHNQTQPEKVAKLIGRADDHQDSITHLALSTGELAEVKKQFLLTDTTLEYLTDAVSIFKSTTGAKISESLFIRSLIKAIHRMGPLLEKEARKIGKVKLPQKIRGKEHLREELENKIAEAIMAAAGIDED